MRRWLLGDRLPRPIKRRELLVLGVDLDDDPFHGPIRRSIEDARSRLQESGRILLDELSNLDFGWPLVGRFEGWEMGAVVGPDRGRVPLLRGFAADGVAICSDVNFATLCDRPSTEPLQFGFLTLHRRDGATSTPPAGLSARSCRPTSFPIPAPRSSARESDHWVRQTATGKLFAFGVLVATIVASAVVYQVLSNDVRDHLPEYATLKAMGHTNGYLARVVVIQALLYAGAAYLVAGILGFGLYRTTEALAGIPMRMTAGILALALLLTLLVGLVSAVFTLNKVWSANPADLF